MPDRRGKPINAGDKVIYAGQYGYVFGVMKFNEDDRKSYHIYINEHKSVLQSDDTYRTEVQTVVRHYAKWPNGILNMTAWYDDMMRTGLLDLPGPI